MLESQTLNLKRKRKKKSDLMNKRRRRLKLLQPRKTSYLMQVEEMLGMLTACLPLKKRRYCLIQICKIKDMS